MAAGLGPRVATSSSAAASAWPATWPSSPSSAAPAEPTAPRSKRILRDRIAARCQESGELEYVNVNELKAIDRQFLVERQLISREHAESEGRPRRGHRPPRASQPDDQRRRSSAHPGDAQRAGPAKRPGKQIDRIDDLIEEQVTFAFHPKLGYLTACPTNVGTGMRVSVMLHLPALVITRQIDKVFRSLQKISLAVRGLYGEGSQAMGDFYQISNQITLGKSEADLVKQVGDIVPVLIDYERQARDFLVKRKPRKPARQGQPGLRHPAHGPDDQLRRDHAPALQRADGRQPGADPRRADSHAQRAVHPHAAGPSAKAARRGARHGRPQHRAGPLPAAPPEPARRRQRRGTQAISFSGVASGAMLSRPGRVSVLSRRCCVESMAPATRQFGNALV